MMKLNQQKQTAETSRIRDKVLMVFSILLLAVSLFSGCDNSVLEGLADDTSFEAKVEEARIALDKGDYSRAVTLLEALVSANPGDALLREYLSNAYAGLAGLDTFSLLTTIEQLDDQNNSGSIDMMGQVLGGSSSQLSRDAIQSKLENLEDAIGAMQNITNPSNDQKIQLGLLAVAHMSLTVGDIVAEDQSASSVDLTEEGLNNEYGSQSAELSNVSADTLNTTGLTNDLGYIADAVTALDGISNSGNDLSQDFSQFENDIDGNQDGSVSQSDLENYLNNEI